MVLHVDHEREMAAGVRSKRHRDGDLHFEHIAMALRKLNRGRRVLVVAAREVELRDIALHAH